MIDRTALPIGVFDSGMGGLTVLRAIHERLPQEQYLYMGDTARLPYGTKGRDTITRYALQAASKLVERGVKMLVIACGTATSVALPALAKAFAPLPVIGVIEPGAAAAVAASQRKHIAVLATEATIRGGAYQKAIENLQPGTKVAGQPCTLFVALAEEGWTTGPLVEGVARRYLAPIFPAVQDTSVASNRIELATAPLPPDTLLLGCTHFPPLKSALQAVLGPGVTLVDSATTTAAAVHKALQAQALERNASFGSPGSSFHGNDHGHGHCHFLTTDDVERFQRIGNLFFGTSIAQEQIELVDL